MTTESESRMREALEEARQYIAGASDRTAAQIDTLIFEALSPPARRTSYEWEFDSTRYRTRFTKFRGFITEINFHGDAWARVEAIDAPAATFAIATLANLTKPEEDEHG